MIIISRIKKVIRNIVILLFVLLLFMKVHGFYLNPFTVYERSERSLHYGPSEVVHVEDIKEGQLILGKYDQWVSCTSMNRKLYFLWSIGSHSLGVEDEQVKGFNYNYGHVEKTYYLYGVINEDRTEKIEIVFRNGEIHSTTEFYEDMFLLTWEGNEGEPSRPEIRDIKSYDRNDDIIYEERLF